VPRSAKRPRQRPTVCAVQPNRAPAIPPFGAAATVIGGGPRRARPPPRPRRCGGAGPRLRRAAHPAVRGHLRRSRARPGAIPSAPRASAPSMPSLPLPPRQLAPAPWSPRTSPSPIRHNSGGRGGWDSLGCVQPPTSRLDRRRPTARDKPTNSSQEASLILRLLGAQVAPVKGVSFLNEPPDQLVDRCRVCIRNPRTRARGSQALCI
jgi:hypothetical protein